MSLLIVNLVPQGIIFGADRAISIDKKGDVQKYGEAEGEFFYDVIHRHYGQTPRPKVLRWPHHKALVGYVTNDATMGGLPTDEWLYDFIGDHVSFTSFATLAESLRQRVEEQRRIDEGDNDPVPLILHLGGFEEKEGVQVPAVWVIRNDHNPPHLDDIRKEFKKVECIWSNLGPEVTSVNIREYLTTKADQYDPFWFHQGIDLVTYNWLERFLKLALGTLPSNKPPAQQSSQTLQDWERQVRMSILMYGAYFQAYKEPYEQYVGGGADTMSISWPVE